MKEKPNKLITRLNLYEKIIVAIIGILFAVYCISLVMPIVWATLMSFKDVIEYTLDPYGLPQKLSFENYVSVWNKMKISVLTSRGVVEYGIFDMVGNTLLLSVGMPLLSVFFTTVMAYVLGRYKFVGSRFLTQFGIILMILPIIGTFTYQYSVYKRLGIYDNILLYILISPQGCFAGMNFLILRAAFKRIPWDYAEAAFVDGGGHYCVFFRIMLPMVIPTSLVFFLLGFLSAWNDYNTTLIWLPSKPTLAYGMYILQIQAVQYEATQPEILAGFILVMIPTVILYLLLHNAIINKVQMGGLKG